MDACKAAGAKRALPLPVSAPFHTSLMKPAADNLADLVNSVTFSAPKVPVVHNVHAKTESNPETIKALMLEQIYSPVKWVDCVNQLKNNGATTLIECGPGKVTFIPRVADRLVKFSQGSPAKMNDGTLAGLWHTNKLPPSK